jgi:glyoxylase-like metal-dependent hydrolase (beta-lactamase superfamily II)
MNAKIIKYYDDLYLIKLSSNLLGFENFLGAWVFKDGKTNFLLDPGPASTINQVTSALKELNIKIDYILLTHIHLDHSGGVGDIADCFPEAFIVCHKSALPHLENPENLWKGSLKVLGDTARKYGRIKPVDKKQLIDSEKFSYNNLKALNTPGHAPHHVSYIYDKYLFAGEAAGISLSYKNIEYSRPATPPKLFFEKTVKSVQKLIEYKPEMICYGHLGLKKDAAARLKKHIDQLYLWKKIIKNEMKNFDDENFFSNCIDIILKKDNNIKGLQNISSDMQKREHFFITNNIKGYVGYLQYS